MSRAVAISLLSWLLLSYSVLALAATVFADEVVPDRAGREGANSEQLREAQVGSIVKSLYKFSATILI